MKITAQHILDMEPLAGRYELDAFIGKGGFGMVFKGRDTRYFGGRDVAIKVLQDDLSLSVEGNKSSDVQRFEQEMAIYEQLRNEHTLKVYDFILEKSGDVQLICIVMELLDGVELEDLLNQGGALSEPDTIQIMRQVLVSLRDAHNKGIIHRDVNPRNLMVTCEDPLFVKVLDYGIAKIYDDELSTLNIKNQTLNIASIPFSPCIMTPEHANHLGTRNRKKDVMQQWGPYTDMWALGIVAKHCLEGHNVFSENTLNDTYYQLLSEEFKLMPYFNGYVGETMKYHPIEYFLADIVNKLLTKNIDPELGPTRYMSCEEVLADLDALEASEDYQAFLKRGNYLKVPLVEEETVRSFPEDETIRLEGMTHPTVPLDAVTIQEHIKLEDGKTIKALERTSKLTNEQLDQSFVDNRTTTPAPIRREDVMSRIREARHAAGDTTIQIIDDDILGVFDLTDFELLKPLELKGRMDFAREKKQARQAKHQTLREPVTQTVPDTITSEKLVEALPAPKQASRWPAILGAVVLLVVILGLGFKVLSLQEDQDRIKTMVTSKKEVKKDEKPEIKTDTKVLNEDAKMKANTGGVLAASGMKYTAQAVILSMKEKTSSKRKSSGRKKPKKTLAKATQPKQKLKTEKKVTLPTKKAKKKPPVDEEIREMEVD